MIRRPTPDPLRRCALLLLLVLLAGCGSRRTEGPLQLKFGHVGAPGSLAAALVDEYARRANQKLDRRAEVVVYGSSQLGSDEVLLKKLKLGTMDFSLPSTIMSSVVDLFGLFEMPYLIRDREHMRRIEQEVFWPMLAPRAEKKGYKVLAVWENGFRHITNNVRPISAPEDLEGVRLRTPRGRWRVKLFESFGASPAPMAMSEVFMALRTGVIDGQENPFAQIWGAKLQEVQRYLSLTRHVYTPSYVVTGAAHWKKLPPDVRTVLEQTARGMRGFVDRKARALEEELFEKLQAAGMEVNRADRESFLEASETIYAEFSRTVEGGAEALDAARKLADASEEAALRR